MAKDDAKQAKRLESVRRKTEAAIIAVLDEHGVFNEFSAIVVKIGKPGLVLDRGVEWVKVKKRVNGKYEDRVMRHSSVTLTVPAGWIKNVRDQGLALCCGFCLDARKEKGEQGSMANCEGVWRVTTIDTGDYPREGYAVRYAGVTCWSNSSRIDAYAQCLKVYQAALDGDHVYVDRDESDRPPF